MTTGRYGSDRPLADLALDELVGDLPDRHPAPWRVEDDWGHDVMDANGREVSHCVMRRDVADVIAATGTRIAAERARPFCDGCGRFVPEPHDDGCEPLDP